MLTAFRRQIGQFYAHAVNCWLALDKLNPYILALDKPTLKACEMKRMFAVDDDTAVLSFVVYQADWLQERTISFDPTDRDIWGNAP